jgi:hypothetical protein
VISGRGAAAAGRWSDDWTAGVQGAFPRSLARCGIDFHINRFTLTAYCGPRGWRGQNLWMFSDADRRVFGAENPASSRRQVIEQYSVYAQAFLEQAVAKGVTPSGQIHLAQDLFKVRACASDEPHTPYGCQEVLRILSERSSRSPGKRLHHQRNSRHAMVPLSDTSPHPEG